MERRDFIKSGLTAGVLAAAGSATQAASAKPASGATMPVRAFGKTGHSFPILGTGGSAYGDNHATAYGGVFTPAFDDRVAMVRAAYDKGVRYFDTARIYGDSEKVTGEALRDVKDDVYINSKVMVDEPRKVRRSVEKSLEELGMDSIDAMMIHGPIIERQPFDTLMGIHAELAKMRDEGLFKFVGMSGHSRFDNMLALIETDAFDTLLIQHGYMRKGFNTRHSHEQLEYQELCLAKAEELNMGIVAMKVMGAVILGHNAKNVVPDFDEAERAKLPAAAIRWAMQDDRIDVMILGLSIQEDLDINIATLNGDLTCTADDKELLARFARHAYTSDVMQEMKVV